MSLLSENDKHNLSTMTVTSLVWEHGTFNPQLAQDNPAARPWGKPATQAHQMEADCMNGGEA